MSKHWEKATEEQVAWADANGFWAVEPEILDTCHGCAIFPYECTHGRLCAGGLHDPAEPSVIFKMKEEGGDA